jgi:hypothetical protein
MTVLAGFLLDYVMQRQGFGPLFNALFVLAGVFIGLYVRFNYLRGYQTQMHDPFLTISSILAAVVCLLVSMAFVRNVTS